MSTCITVVIYIQLLLWIEGIINVFCWSPNYAMQINGHVKRWDDDMSAESCWRCSCWEKESWLGQRAGVCCGEGGGRSGGR